MRSNGSRRSRPRSGVSRPWRRRAGTRRRSSLRSAARLLSCSAPTRRTWGGSIPMARRSSRWASRTGIRRSRSGKRWVLDDSMSTAAVFRTGRSARVDDADWSTVTAPIGALARRLGTSCAVSSPITVDGRLWGAMSVAGAGATAPRHRRPPREVHRARRDGDRERRIAWRRSNVSPKSNRPSAGRRRWWSRVFPPRASSRR